MPRDSELRDPISIFAVSLFEYAKEYAPLQELLTDSYQFIDVVGSKQGQAFLNPTAPLSMTGNKPVLGLFPEETTNSFSFDSDGSRVIIDLSWRILTPTYQTSTHLFPILYEVHAATSKFRKNAFKLKFKGQPFVSGVEGRFGEINEQDFLRNELPNLKLYAWRSSLYIMAMLDFSELS